MPIGAGFAAMRLKPRSELPRWSSRLFAAAIAFAVPFAAPSFVNDAFAEQSARIDIPFTKYKLARIASTYDQRANARALRCPRTMPPANQPGDDPATGHSDKT